MFLTDLQHCVNAPFIIFTRLFSQSLHATAPSANMRFHLTTIFTLAHLLPLSLAYLPQQQQLQKKPFKLAILYNKNIADAHPSFLLVEAILLPFITGFPHTSVPNANRRVFISKNHPHRRTFFTSKNC